MMNKNLIPFSICLLLLSASYGQQQFGDYDWIRKYGINNTSFDSELLSIELGSGLYKNRNNDSNITTMWSSALLLGGFENEEFNNIGIKAGVEFYQSQNFGCGLIPILKTDIYYSNNQLYFQPQIGLSALLMLNLYFGYNIQVFGDGDKWGSAGKSISFTLNMIDII